MTSDPVRGKTLRFTFDDGPMAKKTFEHVFADDGTVTFAPVDREAPDAGDVRKAAVPGDKYEVATIREDVWAVSYRSAAGYTLTTILDTKTGKLVAFSSSDKTLFLQKGSFSTVETGAPGRVQAASSATPSSPRS